MCFLLSFHVTCSPFRGPGDVIGDCKIQFLDEIYLVEKPGARALSAADGQFKRMNKITSIENNTKLAVNSLRTSIQKAYICSQS